MRILRKVVIYCLGLLFLAVGVTFSIKSRLGISPVNSIPYIVSLITGIEQGHVIIAVFSIFIYFITLIAPAVCLSISNKQVVTFLVFNDNTV